MDVRGWLVGDENTLGSKGLVHNATPRQACCLCTSEILNVIKLNTQTLVNGQPRLLVPSSSILLLYGELSIDTEIA